MSIHLEPREFRCSTRLIFGVNSVERIGSEVKRMGASRALIVTDKGIVEAGLLDIVHRALEKEKVEVEVYDQVKPEPKLEDYGTMAVAVKERVLDIVIGLGGGSSLDMAKMAAAVATNPREISEYIGSGLLKTPTLPKILVPTTAGTGSEATEWSVLTVGETKRGIASPYLLADLAIVDPALTVTMPPKTTASTGIDALAHAIESYMSTGSSLITDILALKAIELIARNLREAYYHGEDIRSRYFMSMASTLAGIALSNAGLVIGHPVSYSYAVRFELPHGVASGMALPYVMSYNLPACVERLANVGKAMGVKGYLSSRDAALKAVSAVKSLMEDIGLPTRLKDLGTITEGLASSMANELLSRPPDHFRRNPRRLTKEDAVKIFENILEGRLE